MNVSIITMFSNKFYHIYLFNINYSKIIKLIDFRFAAFLIIMI